MKIMMTKKKKKMTMKMMRTTMMTKMMVGVRKAKERKLLLKLKRFLVFGIVY